MPQFIDYTNWYRVGQNKSATVGSGSGRIEVQDFTIFKYCTPIYVALADPRGILILSPRRELLKFRTFFELEFFNLEIGFRKFI